MGYAMLSQCMGQYFKTGGYNTSFTPSPNGHRTYLLDRIPVGFWLDVQAKAKLQGTSLRGLILTLLKEWLER